MIIFTPMKKVTLLYLLALIFNSTPGIAQTARELQVTAKTYMVQGDYTNAILVLNRAVAMAPDDLEITKDLSVSYFLQRNYEKALSVIKPTLTRNDVDDMCFQIAGNIYKKTGEFKDCSKLYQKGLDKFPKSGPLYNDYGELLWKNGDFTAIDQWESGIQNDPNYPDNYYNASKYYYFTTDKIWSIIYGEIYVNMAPQSSLSPEIKSILLEGYKKLFSEPDLSKSTKHKTKFTEAYIEMMGRQMNLTNYGINTESLTMIRTRFVLDWFEKYGSTIPCRLFEHHRQLLQLGLFDAYNQWLFGTVENLNVYQKWSNTHATECTELNDFLKSKSFRMPANQYYH